MAGERAILMAGIETDGNEPAEKAGKRTAVQAVVCLVLVAAAVAIFLKGCWGGSGLNPADTKPAETAPAEQPSLGSPAAEKDEPKKFYLITALLPKPFRYHTWAYEIMPSGSVKFINLTTKRETVVSQPFTIEEKLAGKGW